MTTDKEKAALVWVNAQVEIVEKGGAWPDAVSDHCATLKAMLAAPRVPDVNDHRAIDELAERVNAEGWGVARGFLSELFRIMHEPPAPATKTVWRVTSDDGCAGSSCDFDTEAEAMDAVQKHLRTEEFWVTIQRREVPNA